MQTESVIVENRISMLLNAVRSSFRCSRKIVKLFYPLDSTNGARAVPDIFSWAESVRKITAFLTPRPRRLAFPQDHFNHNAFITYVFIRSRKYADVCERRGIKLSTVTMLTVHIQRFILGLSFFRF